MKPLILRLPRRSGLALRLAGPSVDEPLQLSFLPSTNHCDYRYFLTTRPTTWP